MNNLTRRSVLRGSAGLLAAGAVARPFIANAAATTANGWFMQGFVHPEDIAMRKVAAEYEKASGNKINVQLIPFAPLREKIVAALTSGDVPDVMDAEPGEIMPEQAWKNHLTDVSDIVETQKSQYSPTALLAARAYNAVERRRSYYGVPYKAACAPFHIWKSLVEKAGYSASEVPDRFDPFIEFFKTVQKKLRAKGMRDVHGCGFTVSTTGFAPTETFDHFMLAYGGHNLVDADGHLHAHDPQVREAAVRVLTLLSTLFKEGYIPHSALNWNDADDNNAFHAQLMVMDFDATLSTELAMLRLNKHAYYHDLMIRGMPRNDEGKQIPSFLAPANLVIPKGAKNVEVAREFLKFLIQPEVDNAYVKEAVRWLPVMPKEAMKDPWWTDTKLDPFRPVYFRQGMIDPTLPYWWIGNPAYAEVWTKELWDVNFPNIVSGAMTPKQAADRAFDQIEKIFAKYPIEET